MNTEPSEPKGTPYPSNQAGSIDQWSLDVFAALSEWKLAHEGAWSRWEPGYLLLEIASVRGCPIEPAVLYTADDELTVAFGGWETHLPLEGSTAADAAYEAVEIIEQWASGDFRTLVFKNSAGGWCGTIPVLPGDLNEQIVHSLDWLARFAATSAELRTARREDWRTISFVEGRLDEVGRGGC